MTRKILSTTEQVKESAKEKAKKEFAPSFIKVLSTGSTLLDLAISGKRIRGGGIPGGIVAEFYGRSQSGKTALLAEISGSCQARGGEVQFKDPEARLDKDYCAIYGLTINDKQYSKPDTVTELFESFFKWEPKNPDAINVQACDSLAALSTELELEKGDKMGMRRAKEFSEGLRKTCRIIEKKNWLILCSNQIRQGDYGDATPGGMAIPFYASVRCKVHQIRQLERERELTINDKKTKKLSKIFGIESKCTVIKSVDEPYREAPIYIVYGYGIDDVRANLQWTKDVLKETLYNAIDKEFKSMDAAIKHIEENNYQNQLKENVIDLWEEIQDKLEVVRKKKIRG